MNITSYKSYLTSQGANLAQVKRNQSDRNMNVKFMQDPAYKRIYILTKDGWKWEDAKYQFHSAQSISKDPVDYYLQFRPKVHYPVGSYVIIPDDTGPDVNLTGEEIQNPFLQPINNRTQWWLIVGRDNANAYVRYMILKCDWEFKWVYDEKIMSCWACSRSASSYTSGIWRDEYSTSTDNLTSSWLPDTYHVYGDKLEELGMSDTRTIMHLQRFFMSNNNLDPKIYQVTKITDISPQGVVKLSIKQDEFNEKRDDVELGICDYYKDNGDVKVETIEPNLSNDTTISIAWMFVDEQGILDYNNGSHEENLQIGKTSYFTVEPFIENLNYEWNVSLIDKSNEYNEEEKAYYEGLMKLTKFDNKTLSLKPGKANSLIGKRFNLYVQDINQKYSSSIEVEVTG